MLYASYQGLLTNVDRPILGIPYHINTKPRIDTRGVALNKSRTKHTDSVQAWYGMRSGIEMVNLHTI